MIQVATVTDSMGPALATQFAEGLEDDYPLVHSTLETLHISQHARVFRWVGDSQAKPIVLMGHFDVVPAAAADGWTEDPFSGTIRDGAVWGRGSLDDKGALVVLLDAVEQLLGEKFTPAQDVYLCFGGNEETFGTAAQEIATAFHHRGMVPWLVLDEGGAVVDSPLPAITAPIAAVGVAEKGVVNLRLRATADPGHSSAPDSDSVIARISRAVWRLETIRFRSSLSGPLREMLADLAPHASRGYRLVLSNLWLFGGLVRRVFVARGGELAAMTRTTVAVTRIEGGSADNVLPSSATATVNIRIAPGESVESVIAAVVRRIADPLVKIEVETPSEPSQIASSTNEQFSLLRRAIVDSYPGSITTPYIMMAATDSRHLHEQTPNVYRFSPLAMTALQRAGIHGVDEHVTIDSLERGVRFFDSLIRHLPH
jgi:carboxypeptidase PM20D1